MEAAATVEQCQLASPVGPGEDSTPPGPAQCQPPRRPLLRAPMVPAAAAMILGTLLGRYLRVPVSLWAVLGLPALLAGAIRLRRPGTSAPAVACVAAAIVAAAAAAANMAFWRVPADHIVNYSAAGSILATVRGQVLSQPQVCRFEQFPWRPAESRFLLRTTAIHKASGGWLRATGLLRVRVKEPVKDLSAGEEVELAGLLRRIRPPSNPGQYDARRADRYRRIYAKLTVPGTDAIRRLRPAPQGPIAGAWWRLRATARAHLTGLGSEEETMLLEALVLGERSPGLRTLNRAMAEAGIAHFLSISGLHLGVFLSVVYGLCRLLTFTRRRAAAAALTVLAAYLLVTEPRAPLLRGALMAAAVCIALITGRGLTTLNALATATVILLLAEPLQLFTPGFQLSFAIVAGIVLLNGPIRRLLFAGWTPRRRVPDPGQDQPLHRLIRAALDWAIMLVCVSLAAYFSAAPLVAYHFGLFSPYAPLLSVLLLPMTVAVLLPAYLSLGLAWLMPNAAAGLGHLAARAGGALHATVIRLGRLPGLSLDLRPLPAGLVVLYYAALGLWALAGRTRRALLPALLATSAALGWTAVTQMPAPPPEGLRLHVLDVGHGAMNLLETPAGGTCLFDAGSLTVPDAYHQVLRPFLRHRKLPSPERIFISHANADHYNALPELLDHRPPRCVYLSEFFGLCRDDPPGAQALLRQFRRRGVEVVRLHAGQSLVLPGGACVEVLWPPPRDKDPGLTLNDRSLVLRVVLGRRAILIPGDIGQAVQARLAAAPADRLRSDVLLLPHHGAFTPALGDFLQRAAAPILLQSAGWRHGNERLARATAGRRRYATYQHGCIEVELDESAVRVRGTRRGG